MAVVEISRAVGAFLPYAVYPTVNIGSAWSGLIIILKCAIVKTASAKGISSGGRGSISRPVTTG